MVLSPLLLANITFAEASSVKSKPTYQWSQLFSDGLIKAEIKGAEHKKFTTVVPFQEYLKSLKNKNLMKVVLLGDTGCRIKDSATKSSYQDCRDPKKWPYKELSDQVATEKSDLIIHTGDFHYREKCSTEKCKEYSKSIGYGWDVWEDDFFAPTAKALKAAPWIIMRGNHEDCERAYKGYKDYLAPRAWKSECSEYEDLELMTIGDVTIVNMDSSGISDFPDPKEESAKFWKEKFAELDKALAKHKPGKYIWFLTHKPIYGFAPLAGAYGPVNLNLRKYFEESKFAKKAQFIVGGHIHSAQTAKAKDFPLQIVMGNSGTALDDFKKPLAASNVEFMGYEKAKNITNDFGYAVVERKSLDSSWMLVFKGVKGEIQFSCQIDSKDECFK